MYSIVTSTNHGLIVRECRHSYNVFLALGDGKWSIQGFERLSEGVQPQISVEELVACEKVVKNDPRVQQLAKEVGKMILFTRKQFT